MGKKGAGAGAFSNLVLQLPRRKAAVLGHDHLQFKGGKKTHNGNFLEMMNDLVIYHFLFNFTFMSYFSVYMLEIIC